MKFPGRPAGPSPSSAPSPRRLTFDSIERQLSALSLRVRCKTRSPPPSYTEATAGAEEPAAGGGALKSHDTWQTVASTSSDAAEKPAGQEVTRLAKPAAEKPAGHEVARLAKPVAVPRVCPGPTMPFARAWAPCLAGHEIDAAVFLAFVDGLNLVTAPHPAIKLVELAGFCMNFVPLPYADALAAILQVTAVVATVLVARHRGRRYLDRLNADVFEPRGLHVATMGTTKLKARLGIAHDRVLLAPLTDMTLHLSAQERCLLELETWAAALVTDGVPPPLPLGPPQSPPADGSKNGSSGGANVLDGINNMLNRYTSWRIRSAIRKADRSAARGRRRAWKRHLKGKPLKEAWGEKTRVGKLSWIVVRNLDDVVRERAEKAAAREAKKKGKGRAGMKM